MPLKYTLHSNKVLKEEGVYRALIKGRRKYTLDDIVNIMEGKGTTISRTDAVASIELFTEVVENILEEGGVVSTPLFHASCSISGKFRGSDDRFFSSRHTIKINMRPGKRLKRLTTFIKTKKVPASLPTPEIKHYTDMVTGSIDDKITLSSPALINGSRLSFDSQDPNQGIYFVSATNVEYKVNTIHKITFSQLLFLNPEELPAGQYRLVIKSSMNVKDIRMCTHSKFLEVL